LPRTHARRKVTRMRYDHSFKTLTGETTTLEPYKGKVLLIVNVASHCGHTPQYKGLQATHEHLSGRGLVVLGFPCNQFGAQEPGTSEQIAEFCTKSFRVSFPMFEKIDVNGPHTHPLFAELKHEAPGLLGSESIKWNFTKFLVDRKGKTVRRYAPAEQVEGFVRDIEELL
jgi:glutathione peroxidase